MRVVQSASTLFGEANGEIVHFGFFGGHLEIWTLCTIRKYVFLNVLKDPAIMFPPTNTLIPPSVALGLFSARRLGSMSFGILSPLLTNCYNFPCLMKASICWLRS